MEGLTFLRKPILNQPYLVAGFTGWANAADISSGVVNYLKEKLDAVRFAEIDPDPFYDFTTSRPFTNINQGVMEDFSFVKNRFYHWQHPDREHDLILFIGAEPHLRWQQYGLIFFSVVEEYKVSRLLLLGSYHDSTPHTHPPNVAAAVTNTSVKEELSEYGIQFTSYQGPTSIHSLIQQLAYEREVPSIALWTSSPHYLSTTNPKSWLAVLDRLLPIVRLQIDLEDLRVRAQHLDRQIDQAILQNPKLQEYVRYLEEAMNTQPEEPLQSDEIVRSLEEFLKRRQKGS